MTIACFILADDQDMSWTKFFPIAIVLAFWIVGALMKQQKQIRRGSPPPPRRPDMPSAAEQAAVLAAMTNKPRPAPARKGRRVPKLPPAPQTVGAAAPVAPPPMAPANLSLRVEASAISRRLTPSALRTRFILTEILRPPVTLREPDER